MLTASDTISTESRTTNSPPKCTSAFRSSFPSHSSDPQDHLRALQNGWHSLFINQHSVDIFLNHSCNAPSKIFPHILLICLHQPVAYLYTIYYPYPLSSLSLRRLSMLFCVDLALIWMYGLEFRNCILSMRSSQSQRDVVIKLASYSVR